jgi:hypothetical protein
VPDEEGPGNAAAQPTEAARSSARTSFVAPRSSCPTVSAPSTAPRAQRGFMAYLNAGANASAGRDASVGPLDAYAAGKNAPDGA